MTRTSRQLREPAAPGRLAGRLGAFARDARGAAAVEFAFVGVVFITLLLAVLQFALVFLAQMNLHDAVSDAATGNNAQTLAGNRSAVITQICGRMVIADNCVANITLETQPLSAYGGAAQPIGATFSSATVGTPMVIRARVPVVTFVPGLPDLSVSGSALYARRT
ncbi:TadE/TadG family type IV pilus assembly protein [Bosea sp. (in: a-proteobacteria)]|uniref:TadE/TadG family type IV pilus assembly protein n=1 Tax=Bosea sp. (in: a-proteobacteria) TaxID=1871050 RepID=UPI002FC8EA6F